MFAGVIIHTKAKELDRPFSYRIPKEMLPYVTPGVQVTVPFGRGNVPTPGFVISLHETIDFDESRCKDLLSIAPKSARIEDELITLAIKMRHRFGGTLFQSLSVAIPEKKEVVSRKERFLTCLLSEEALTEQLQAAEHKKHYAKARLLSAFLTRKTIPLSLAADRLNISSQTVNSLLKAGVLTIETENNGNVSKDIREKSENGVFGSREIRLNEEQEKAVCGILNSEHDVHLLYGVTGSGKTEVYLELIDRCLKSGKSAIVLIPEISLTYQTVMRFYKRFGEAVSIVHSKLSKGEKWERFEKAKNGEIKIMIGPRSALFTPFRNLGMIIIDEFHDGSYESEQVPRYNAPWVAEERIKLSGGKLVLGSATPLVSTFTRAKAGEIGFHTLTHRASEGSVLPKTEIVDMRAELSAGNRSVFSRSLRKKMEERFRKHEQVMLFLNRRGYSGAVSCRSCGEPIQCPHCSVSLNYHKNHTLQCHMCGYSIPMVEKCPKCGSKLIGTFGIGTEKVEAMAKELFPGIKTLRMDADTTAKKGGHEEIIETFAAHGADMLIGTQMIVKGHDFPDVTLMGVLAADLSLYVQDYKSAETTFALLSQAAGRAGRRGIPGECVIQTYTPEHYAVDAAKNQDYDAFYEREAVFRRQLRYPPFGVLMGIRLSGPDERKVEEAASLLLSTLENVPGRPILLGPSEDSPYKVKDQYRRILYVKTKHDTEMSVLKQAAETLSDSEIWSRNVYMTLLS